MPPSELAVASGTWVERDGFLVEERLSALGVRHGVTTRALGNMKSKESRDRAAGLLGLKGSPVVLQQVHGTTIRVLSEAVTPEARAKWPLEGDGWIADQPGVACGVFIADCVPLYLWSRDGSAVGVFHAGWRGLEAEMVVKAVFAMMLRGPVQPKDLFGAVGPSIGPCCYAVGPEFRAKALGAALTRRGDKDHLDLGAFVRRQWDERLRRDFGLALAPDQLSTDAPCTSCGADRFHSFRRDKQDARLLALLASR